MLKIPFPKFYKRLFTPTLKEKKKDVFIKFYEWIIKQAYPTYSELFNSDEITWKLFQVNSVCISKKDLDKLRRIFLKKEKKDSPFYKKSYLENCWGMHFLQHGPSLFWKYKKELFKPDWVIEIPEEGFVYIDEKRLFEDKNGN